MHRYRDFADLTYLDFILSAAAVAPILAEASQRGVGPAILDAIRATQRVVTTNTNLGIVLLLAPLAAVPRERELQVGISDVLNSLTLADSRNVFEAIRLVNPGGLALPPSRTCAEPTLPLRAVMAVAADRDLIARQYTNDFREVFDIGVPALCEIDPLEAAIIRCQLRLLAAKPDSHIARRCGLDEAAEVSRRAADVLAGADLAAFDAWLREDGQRRNPGTTADLVTASLFVALREGIIKLPVPFSSR